MNAMGTRRAAPRHGDDGAAWPADVRVEYGPRTAALDGGSKYEVFVDDVSVGTVEQRKASRWGAGAWAAAGWGWTPSFPCEVRGTSRRERTRDAATAVIVTAYLAHTKGGAR